MSETGVNGFHVGMKFESFDSLKNYIIEHERKNFTNLKIRDSRSLDSARNRVNRNIKESLAYYEITYVCYFGTHHRNRGNGERKKNSLKRDCPFKVTLRATADGNFLEIRSLNTNHNHPNDPWIYENLPAQRRLDLCDDYLSELISLGANKKLIQAKINAETGKNVPLKAIHNIKRFQKVGLDSISFIIDILKNEYNSVVNILSNDNNNVCGIFFMDKQMLNTLNLFPELLMLDATYKLLDSR